MGFDYLIYDDATYLLLAENFKKRGLFDDADNCLYVCRDKMKNENKKFNWSKIYDNLLYGSCGYGVRPDYIVGWILVSTYIFWVIFLG